MDIREVYSKYYYHDLHDEFNYPESNEGYNKALDIVVECLKDNMSVADIVGILAKKKTEYRNETYNDDQSYKFNCRWLYVSQNLPTAMKIAKEDITSPIFIDYGTGALIKEE